MIMIGNSFHVLRVSPFCSIPFSVTGTAFTCQYAHFRWIEPFWPRKEVNNSNRVNIGAETAQLPPYSADGSGVVVGEWDGGGVDINHADFGLTNLLNTRIFKAGERAGERHVCMKHRGGLRQCFVNRRVYAVAGALDIAAAALGPAVVDADFHK